MGVFKSKHIDMLLLCLLNILLRKMLKTLDALASGVVAFVLRAFVLPDVSKAR